MYSIFLEEIRNSKLWLVKGFAYTENSQSFSLCFSFSLREHDDKIIVKLKVSMKQRLADF